ncbi:MAG: tetraacyldisaccharide 4'-kinase [Bacteroidales bacterium]
MENTPKIRHWLLPLSYIYGFITKVRNVMFDYGILKSEEYDVAVISVGNITVGGTGKTPHTEYLINMMQKSGSKVAVLSRGYKRKSSGFHWVESSSSPINVGDEPFQMKMKYPEAIVAVDGNRRRGIKHILDKHPDTNVILLDDAFQHRWVKAGISILLMDYNRKVYEDKLLPAGSLRESITEMDRANIIIVTKSPRDLSPMDVRVISKHLEARPHQLLYFTDFRYQAIKPLFPELAEINGLPLEDFDREQDSVLLVTGIASNIKLINDLSYYVSNIVPLAYPDHHSFSLKDLQEIDKAYESLSGDKRRIVLVTEKDAVRLMHMDQLSDEVKRNIYYVPIEVNFLHEQQLTFNSKLIDYVRKNKPNSRVLERGY